MNYTSGCQPGRSVFFSGILLSALCGDDGVGTRDLVVANHALSQLSYIPACTPGGLRPPARHIYARRLATLAAPTARLGVLGFEPRTSALSELRSSQLSYTPSAPRR